MFNRRLCTLMATQVGYVPIGPFKKDYNSFEKTQKFNVVLSNELKNTYDRITPREQRNKYDFLEFIKNPEKEDVRKLALGYTVLITSGNASISSVDKKMYNDFIQNIINKNDIYNVSKIFK